MKDYIGWPVISAGAFALVQLASGGRLEQPAKSRVGRRLRKISSGGASARPRTSWIESRPGWKALTCALCPPTPWRMSFAMCGRTPSSSAATFPTRPTRSARKRSRTRRARMVPAPVGRRGQYRRQPAVPRDQRQPRLPSGAPSVSGYAEPAGTPRSRRKSRTSASATSCRTTPGLLQAVVHGPPHDLSSGIPRRKTAAKARPLPRRGASTARHESSEATKFRDRVPAEHPAAGPEHDSSGVEVQPPPRGND